MKTLAIIIGALVTATSANVLADSYPTRPVTLVVGFTPGGAGDTIARVVGDALARELGQPIVIDNKAGAGGTIATAAVAGAQADGYTLLLSPGTQYGPDQTLFSVKYVGERDFTPITMWAASPLILAVNPNVGINSLGDLVEATKRDKKIFYSSSGIGVLPHIAAAYFSKIAGAPMEHVPYKGGAQAIQAVAAGEVQLTFGTPPSVLPMARSGKLKALAVTSNSRSALMPDLPSLAEEGVKGYDLQGWFGLFGPTNLPRPIVDKLFAASAKVLAMTDVKAKLARAGNEAAPSASPEAFKAKAIADGTKGRELLGLAGVKGD